MSMQISSSTNAGLPAATLGTGRGAERRESYKDLSQALQSNDLSGARAAYANIVRNAPPNATLTPGSPFAQLGKALVTGDLEGAKVAAGQIKQNRGNPADPAPAADLPRPPVNGGSGFVGFDGASINITV